MKMTLQEIEDWVRRSMPTIVKRIAQGLVEKPLPAGQHIDVNLTFTNGTGFTLEPGFTADELE